MEKLNKGRWPNHLMLSPKDVFNLLNDFFKLNILLRRMKKMCVLSNGKQYYFKDASHNYKRIRDGWALESNLDLIC